MTLNTTPNPLVSVLICTHNAEKFIEGTLESVLNQTYQSIEVLVLDNSSHDHTTQLINQLSHSNSRLKLYKSDTNMGPYSGLNFLINKAKGAYIAINDHDDIWHQDKIKKQVSFLETHKEFVACGTAIINWYEKYETSVYRTRNKKDCIAWHTSLVFRSEGYRYDESIPIGGDFYFMEKILCGSKKLIYNFEEPLVLRRIFRLSKNLSGAWMTGFSLSDLFKLKLPIADKLAILNRMMLPRELIEWIIIKIWGNNIPEKYNEYATTYQIT